MADPGARPGGVLGSIRRMRDTVLALLGTRLELAALELQQEWIRLADLLLRVATIIVLGTLALLALTALVVVALWDKLPPALTLAVITAIYALAAWAVTAGLKKRLRSAPPPFIDTLAELKKDCECFREKK
jgi:uncharacterized membrane protein YqjE